MDTFVVAAIPVATLVAGVWCGVRIERHRRDRELDELFFDERPTRSGFRDRS